MATLEEMEQGLEPWDKSSSVWGGEEERLTNRFAFVSRHEPTIEQIEMALAQGIELEFVGDRDAFEFNPNEFKGFDGVICVHPLIAIECIKAKLAVGVFKNGNRAQIGEKSQFYPVELRVEWYE